MDEQPKPQHSAAKKQLQISQKQIQPHMHKELGNQRVPGDSISERLMIRFKQKIFATNELMNNWPVELILECRYNIIGPLNLISKRELFLSLSFSLPQSLIHSDLFKNPPKKKSKIQKK